MSTRKKVINLSASDARKYFLETESYAEFDLPSYFDFSGVLKKAGIIYNKKKQIVNIAKKIEKINKKGKKEVENLLPEYVDGVNRVILDNKDGKNAWRPFSLIHPILYVHLVHLLTEADAWKALQSHFAKNRPLKITCTSIPLENDSSKQSNRTKEQILEWWEEVEQESFKLALDFAYVIKTDITDCYNSIYTHSISWALHGRELCKKVRKKEEPDEKIAFGNSIDKAIQMMQCGQTHGIPQGSALMDFIAEIVLAALDNELAVRIKANHSISKDYKIIRYRDDYRIFAKEKRSCQLILKELGDVLREYGLTLNSKKTVEVRDVIKETLKEDKWELINSSLHLSLLRSIDCADGLKRAENDVIVPQNIKMGYSYQKLLLQIYDFSLRYTNAGQMKRLLSIFGKVLPSMKGKKEEAQVMISIITNMILSTPKVYPHCVAIISRLTSCFSLNDKKKIVSSIVERFAGRANADFFNIWMQRITEPIGVSFSNSTKLCEAVTDASQVAAIWNNDWMEPKIRTDFESCDVVDRIKLQQLEFEVRLEEVDAFMDDDY